MSTCVWVWGGVFGFGEVYRGVWVCIGSVCCVMVRRGVYHHGTCMANTPQYPGHTGQHNTDST